jgi:geranylgeranyl pyrophosphate synthase
MIEYKTAVSCSRSNENGCDNCSNSEQNANLISRIWIKFRSAFQLQDDYLTRLVTKTFGETSGGDIIENKKTYL